VNHRANLFVVETSLRRSALKFSVASPAADCVQVGAGTPPAQFRAPVEVSSGSDPDIGCVAFEKEATQGPENWFIGQLDVTIIGTVTGVSGESAAEIRVRLGDYPFVILTASRADDATVTLSAATADNSFAPKMIPVETNGTFTADVTLSNYLQRDSMSTVPQRITATVKTYGLNIDQARLSNVTIEPTARPPFPLALQIGELTNAGLKVTVVANNPATLQQLRFESRTLDASFVAASARPTETSVTEQYERSFVLDPPCDGDCQAEIRVVSGDLTAGGALELGGGAGLPVISFGIFVAGLVGILGCAVAAIHRKITRPSQIGPS
jgi:hypothetical protein